MGRRPASLAAGLAAVLSCALAAAPAGAAAPEPDIRAPKMDPVRRLDDALVLEPGRTCLERDRLLSDIEGYRGHARVDQQVAIRVQGSSEDPRSLRFEVRVRESVAVERPFDAAPADCADLHAVVALAIAIALDDTLPQELGIVAPPVPVAQVAPGESDLPQFDNPPLPPRGRRGPGLGLTLAGGVFVGVLPRISGGAALAFDLRPLERFDLRFGALVTHLPNYALDTGQVDLTLAAGRLDLCWGTRPRRLRLRLCGGAAAGATVAQGEEFTNNFRHTLPWGAGIVSSDLVVRLIGRLALELRVEGVVPFQRTILDVRSTTGQLLARERFPVAGGIISVGPRLEF